MAGNKHALTLYRVLDTCFSNRMRKYYAEDLIKKCNEALAERYGTEDPASAAAPSSTTSTTWTALSASTASRYSLCSTQIS